MNKNWSLRQRIILSYFILTLLSCSTFIIIFLFAEKTTENLFINNRMSIELDGLIHNGQSDQRFAQPSVGTKFYFGDNIPAPFLELEPGSDIYEISYEDRDLFVLLRMFNSELYVITTDQSAFESAESLILTILVGASAMSLILALVLAKLSANRVIMPLTLLAKDVSSFSARNKYALKSSDEIGVLARAIEERNNQLNQFLIREQLFTGDVSHELRTPLTIILGAAEILHVNLKGDSNLLQYAERIRNTALDTTQRMTALLLLARSPENLNAPRISLRNLVQNEIDRNSFLVKDKPLNCILTATADVSVYARPELAGIAIGNLIRNACQYTEKGEVTVTLSQNELIIEDTGYGIPEGIRTLLFDRFVRGYGKEQPGSGLGLSIVKRVCEHIGWDIKYEPVASGGSRFILNFNSQGAS